MSDCLSTIANRWKHSSLFDVQKIMFEWFDVWQNGVQPVTVEHMNQTPLDFRDFFTPTWKQELRTLADFSSV